jgi:hypothetical protein
MFEIESKQIVGAIGSALEPQYSAAGLRDAILEIIYPEAGKLRSRKVVSRSRARATGKFPSWKMARMIQWESVNELNAYRRLDATPSANAFYEQPLMIRFALDGEVHIHYPDVLVDWGHRKELWEIKRNSDASNPVFANRTRLLAAALPQHGFAYRMVVADELSREPQLSNSLILLKHGREAVCDIAREQVRQVLLSTMSITWESATKGDLGRRGRAVLARLALEGYLAFDTTLPISSTTRFWRSAPRNPGAA